jgi:endonuclease YncB( thermonuclease family)
VAEQTAQGNQLSGRYDDDRRDELDGPSEEDIARYSSEEYELLEHRRRQASSALWKLVTGAIAILLAAALLLNVLLPVFLGRDRDNVPDRVRVTVTRVVDANTIRVVVDGEEHTVRYIGVQTPGPEEELYATAVAVNRQWLAEGEVFLEADRLDADSDGTLLRYVWVGDAMVNLNLVGVGLARTADDSENNRYRDVFLQVEQNAMQQNLGIWEGADRQPSAALLPSGPGAGATARA